MITKEIYLYGTTFDVHIIQINTFGDRMRALISTNPCIHELYAFQASKLCTEIIEKN